MDFYKCRKGCCTIKIRPYNKLHNKYKQYTNYKKTGVFLYDPKEDRVLIVQSRGHLFSPPKGSLEIGESEIKGAIREVLEETGIDISNKWFSKATRIKDRAIFFYLELDTCIIDPQNTIDDNDANGLTWIKIDCLEECIKNGNIVLNHYAKIVFYRFLKKSFPKSGFNKVTYNNKGRLIQVPLY